MDNIITPPSPKVTTGPLPASRQGLRHARRGARHQRAAARDRAQRARPSRGSASTTRPAPTPIPRSPSTWTRAWPARAAPGCSSAAASRNMTAARSRPIDNGNVKAAALRRSPTRRGRCAACPASRSPSSSGRAPGIITKEMIYVAERENLGRKAALDVRAGTPGRRRELRRGAARIRHARVRARRSGARPRHHPGQHQPSRARADDHRPQLPGQDQRQHRQLGGRPPRWRKRSRRWCGRSAGAPTRSWTCRPAATSTTRANGSCAMRRCRSAPCRSTRRWRRSAAIRPGSTGRSIATR